MPPLKNDDTSSLSHTKWNCQYHIVFTPKYRRKAIYAKLRSDIGKYLRRLCEYKGVEIVEAHAMPDHIHMLVKIPPKMAVSSFMGYLKGKSSLMIFDEHANLKYNYGSRHFWSEGYYVSTVGLNKKTIVNYIKNQELEDQLKDKKSIKEYKERLRVSKSDKGNWAIKNTPKSGWPVTSLEGDAKNHALKTWIFIFVNNYWKEPKKSYHLHFQIYSQFKYLFVHRLWTINTKKIS